MARVFHLTGPLVESPELEPISKCPYLDQRCVRCGALLDRRFGPFPRFPTGKEIERDEDPETGRVNFTAEPMYDIDDRYRQQQKPVPRCQVMAF